MTDNISGGSKFVKESSIILTAGGSRVVRALLTCAAEKQTKDFGSPKFKVIYVSDERFRDECDAAVSQLRQQGISVAEIPAAAAAHAMHVGKVNMVLLGAESVTLQGGVLSRMGTYQIAELAKAMNKEVTVVAETYKFVNVTVLAQRDMPRIKVNQTALDFRTTDAPKEADPKKEQLPLSLHVDFTPANLITRIITEVGPTYPPVGPYEMIVDMHAGRM